MCKRRPILVRTLSALGVVAAALVLAVAAGSEIVPGQSIGGVTLGMTQAQVRAALGKPQRIRSTPPSSREPAWTYFAYDGYEVAFACSYFNCTRQGRTRAPFVRYVWTTAKSERTARGAGIGSTRAQLKQRVPAVECRQAGDTGKWDSLECSVDGRDIRPGEPPRMYFQFKNGRVGAISLYYAGHPR